MAFLLHAKRLLGDRRPARLDHATLLATLEAERACRRSARDRENAAAAPAKAPREDPLTELLTVGPRWRQAASAQGGCFNRAESERRVNGS